MQHLGPETSRLQDIATTLKATLQRAIDRTFPHSKKLEPHIREFAWTTIPFDQILGSPTPELGAVKLTDSKNTTHASAILFAFDVDVLDETSDQWSSIENKLCSLLVDEAHRKLGETCEFAAYEFLYSISNLHCNFSINLDHIRINIELMQLLIPRDTNTTTQ
jgi:hypothetical protein